MNKRVGCEMRGGCEASTATASRTFLSHFLCLFAAGSLPLSPPLPPSACLFIYTWLGNERLGLNSPAAARTSWLETQGHFRK